MILIEFRFLLPDMTNFGSMFESNEIQTLTGLNPLINGIRKHGILKIQFDTNQFLKNISKSNSYFHTFINKENLAAGILRLEPKESDTQRPHNSDEIYYIIRGDGFLNIDGKEY